MAATLKVLPDTKEPVYRRNGETTWDGDLGFHLYCVGLNFAEIGHKFGVSARTVCHRADVEGWDAKREIVLLERAKRVGMAASKEQEFIRAQECDLARKLLGMGHELLRKIKIESATVSDLCRVLELASRLGRLGSGLPLMPVELHATMDLSESLQQALDRAYPPEPKPIDIEPPKELPPSTALGMTAESLPCLDSLNGR
jgi:hypothetical protein